ncbi:sporulation integral membrane protein YtvI [Ectobacillus antri]|jgi:sporulation integral membrane protein YtvI|uniref:Sporulation integral membrane protein YtvI n=1 Tax=Ectobacillus antri TaxID=2486280 RepID=A0ABT6H554_9BACI|nr:sporulation integral membrane protein YtvI [Ectobacillus antri]MDG4657383.1 sporulation integral membrane protein YtvI [Ectobacillus antri]MDG5754486.1 sporulation integral membrane protein YtvI [Ectobacillus antri]
MWKKWLLVSIFILIILFLIPYSLPVIFALLTAILLEGIVSRLQKHGRFPRLYAVLTAFLLYLATLTLIGYFMIHTIFQQVVSLSHKAPGFAKEFYYTTVLPMINSWHKYSETLPTEVLSSIERALENSVNSLDLLAKNLISGTIGFVAVVPGFLLEFLIYLIALFLISLELPSLKEKLESYMTLESREKFHLVAEQLSGAGVGFVKAQLFLSLLTFTMAYVGLWLLDVPYTALLSLLIVIVDILPILGTGSVLVPWATVAILQDNQTLGIGLLVLFGVITIVRRIIEPKVYSKSMGISPLAALVSLYVGFKLLGFIGLFLGPSLVILYESLKKSGVIRIRFKI